MTKLIMLSHLVFSALAGGLCWHVATDYAELNAYRAQGQTVTASGNELNKALMNATRMKGN